MNKDLLIKGMIFLAGGAIGSLVTWKLVKTKYEQIADEEIDSMREYYTIKINGEKTAEDKPTVQEIRDEVQKLGEINKQVMAEQDEDEEEDEEDMSGPVVIPPEESWERDYPTLSLIYFEGDTVLADESDKIVGNIDELVGEDFASHFGEYEEDSVFVRNDKLGVYYEILRDYGTYAEHIGE